MLTATRPVDSGRWVHCQCNEIKIREDYFMNSAPDEWRVVNAQLCGHRKEQIAFYDYDCDVRPRIFQHQSPINQTTTLWLHKYIT